MRSNKLLSRDFAFDFVVKAFGLPSSLAKRVQKLPESLLPSSLALSHNFRSFLPGRHSQITIVSRKEIASVLTPLFTSSLTCDFFPFDLVVGSQITIVSRKKSTEIASVLAPFLSPSLTCNFAVDLVVKTPGLPLSLAKGV